MKVNKNTQRLHQPLLRTLQLGEVHFTPIVRVLKYMVSVSNERKLSHDTFTQSTEFANFDTTRGEMSLYFLHS